MQLIKKDGEKTLKQIIEDTKSGIPAKSELVQKVFTYCDLCCLGKKGIFEEVKQEKRWEGRGQVPQSKPSFPFKTTRLSNLHLGFITI